MVQIPRKAALTAPFQSAEAFRDFCRAPETAKGQTQVGNSRWSNRDLEPTHPEERTWTWYNLPAYWFTTAFGVTGWNAAASLIAVGLTWRETFASAFLGSFMAALVVVFMARPGVMYHVGYPVITRTVMGMYGSYFFIFIRAMVCIIWYGIQTYYGGNLFAVCCRCIFGSAWESWPNALPESAHVTSKQLLGFFIVWYALQVTYNMIIQFPFMFVHPSKIQYLFTAKGIIMPIATFGLFGWAVANGAGLGALDLANAAGEKAAATTNLGWSIMSGINVIMGTLSPMLVNQPDMARYCKKPWYAGWVQFFAVLLTKALVLFLGLYSTVTLAPVLGDTYWNLWDLLDAILDLYWTPAARAGVFLTSFCFLFAVFGSNIGANSLPFGADLTGLSPGYMTIKRGQVLCAILGIAVMPWELLANASAFLSFLGSYNIFMAPICAIIAADYFIVRKGNIHILSAYDGNKGGLYWFWGGVNWLAVLAWCIGMSFGLPGLVSLADATADNQISTVAQYQPQAVSQAAKNMYKLGFPLAFTAGGASYLVLTFFVKLRILPNGLENMTLGFEYLAMNGREGFLDGERDEYAASPVVSESEDARIGENEKASKVGV